MRRRRRFRRRRRRSRRSSGSASASARSTDAPPPPGFPAAWLEAAPSAAARRRRRARAAPRRRRPGSGGTAWAWSSASPTGAVAFSGHAEGLSHLHGASWLVEARDRQARAERLEERAEFYKAKAVAAHLERRQMRTTVAVWRGWWTLVLASRWRRAATRRAAAAAAAAAPDGKDAPSGSSPPGRQHQPRPVLERAKLASLAAVDHSEWWERGRPTKAASSKLEARVALV